MGKEKKKKKEKSKKKDKEEKERLKKFRKAHETPEERRIRRLEKKQKKYGYLEGDAKADSICGYTNEANPFGDQRLTETFVWHKRNKKMAEKGVEVKEKLSAKEERKRREKIEAEIEKVKKRREEREEEQALWEEEKLRMMREREMENYADWEKKEEEMNRKTNLIRSQIRIKEGREKPIDQLAKNLNLDTELDCEIEEPSSIFNNLNGNDLEELHRDIIAYREYDPHTEFWQQLLVVCEDELAKKKRNAGRSLDGGVHDAVKDQMEELLSGKTHSELLKLESQITTKLASDEDVDTEYWDALLKKLQVFKAKERLREIHQETLQRKLAQLLAQQEEEGDDEYESDEEEEEDADGDATMKAAGGEDAQASAGALATSEEAAMMAREKGKTGEADEEDFKDEVTLDSKVYWWQDKYRPRKPKYFNRVHTGYEWNKYNQTHYDHDNPPPKVVQGYKFNIFYPDLIDKTQTPTYFVEPCEEPDLQTIRFHAGPPYEDIAFKIVKREWEYTHRRGFKCSFERGILHLYFRFRRYFYRK